MLSAELSGKDLAQTQTAMLGDRVSAAAARLQNAADGIGTNEEAIFDTLSGLRDPTERDAVEKEYKRQTGHSLGKMLQEEFSSTDFEVASKLQTGRKHEADAVRLDAAMHGGFWGTGLGTDEAEIYRVLRETKNPAERKRMLDAYAKRTGQDLKTDLSNEMGGAALDESLGYLAGNETQAKAARIRRAAEGWGTDEEAIFGELSSGTEQDRKKLFAEYGKRYGGLDHMMKQEMSGMDQERARQLLENGMLDPVFAMRYAMDGIGTDEGMLRQTLSGMTSQQTANLRVAYQQQTGRNLDREMKSELSGRDEHYILQMMDGKPVTLHQKLARSREDYDFERGSGAGLLGRFTTCSTTPERCSIPRTTERKKWPSSLRCRSPRMNRESSRRNFPS